MAKSKQLKPRPFGVRNLILRTKAGRRVNTDPVIKLYPRCGKCRKAFVWKLVGKEWAWRRDCKHTFTRCGIAQASS